ncbi:MAG: NrfD/PsrC family molybdoenzyme membrane anchor subunit [Pirellulaceae bacterium]
MANGTTTAEDNVHPSEAEGIAREPLVLNNRSMGWITDRICGIVENRQPMVWWFLFIPSVFLASCLLFTLVYLVSTGVGVWGNNQPVAWGWAIVNFVFWIGIGHAGTLISAILFLTRQRWRTSVNRSAEAMTLFAVVCAGIYPGFHVGRFWMVWFLAPVPNANAIWQNFKSPLLWDVFAVSTYFTVSLLFWYMGMVPDLATFRDRAKTKTRKFIYGVLSLGWSGSARHWHRYEVAYTILAALATPLVLSVHTIVSFDFAISIIPGWHTTIFPPYFVAGAIFSGFAMVVTLLVPMRSIFNLKHVITVRHIENMNKIIMVTGLMVGTAYTIEFFIAWYSANPYEGFAFRNRAGGPFWWAYLTMFTCNVFVPQLFWSKRIRTSMLWSVIIGLLVNVGMWFERFVIVMTLNRGFLPSSWSYFRPTWVDIGMLIGSFGLFMFLYLLFCRFLPVIAMSEVKGTITFQKHMAEAGGYADNQSG